MAKVTTDIDIDFANRDLALMKLMSVPASMESRNEIARHPTGVYFQNIPTDPLTSFAALNYEEAAERGYFKIDFLNNSIYDGVRDEDHLLLLMADPSPQDWEMFEEEALVSRLAHIHSSLGIVRTIRPRSVDDLAVILALQRPGKRHLLGKPRAEIDAEIWKPNEDGFVFKRAHAIAYAVSIVVQYNLLMEQTAAQLDGVPFEP